MPRYIILLHETSSPQRGPVHWDFMLETGGVLRTWALAEEPAAKREIAADQLADHRLAYLEYEGPISGDRGSVTRWDAGEYRSISESAGELRVALKGQKLSGEVVLRREEGSQRWRFAFST
jgi:hypothetical protein